MRILICTAGIPHESEGASTVLFFHYIRQLSKAGYQIHHLLLLEGKSWTDEAVRDYAGKFDKPGMFEVDVARSAGFVKGGRFTHRLDDDALVAPLERARQFQPDLILAFDILPAWVLQHVPASHRIVWLGDLHFHSFWWNAIYAVKENIRALRQFPAIVLTCHVWKNIYRSVLADADQVVVSSVSSVAHMKRLGIYSEYEPYPWPETVAEAGDRPPRGTGRPNFVFFGNLVGLGSRSALHFLIDKLYPRLRRYWGPSGFSVVLAGRGKLPDWFESMIADKPEIRFLGFVASIQDLLSGCDAVLVPISVPVGNRSRILTAMANGALVIAHKNASLGNSALVDGETCYLARSADEFVAKMKLAVEDKSAAKNITQRARECYQSQFSPDVAACRLVTRVASLAAS